MTKRPSQSKRIRALIYQIGKARGLTDDQQEEYYQERTEQIIEVLKKKLDNLINPPPLTEAEKSNIY